MQIAFFVIIIAWGVLLYRRFVRIGEKLGEQRRQRERFSGQWPGGEGPLQPDTHGTLVKDARTGEYRVQKRDRI